MSCICEGTDAAAAGLRSALGALVHPLMFAAQIIAEQGLFSSNLHERMSAA
jgi:hypothetical protein